MNIKLAKKLRDAGFPNLAKELRNADVIGRTFLGTDGETSFGCLNIEHLPEEDDSKNRYFLYPTLSELIEACGDRFSCVERMVKTEEMASELWLAAEYAMSDGYKSGKGSTPEEAVANLWLALKKEKDEKAQNQGPPEVPAD